MRIVDWIFIGCCVIIALSLVGFLIREYKEMPPKLKTHIIISVVVWIGFVGPFIIGMTIALIGISKWGWEGRATIPIICGIVGSIFSSIVTYGFLEEAETLLEEYLVEKFKGKETKPPKAEAWKETL